MLVDKKPLVYIWRPFYRFTFDGIVWPFLERVKTLFFAESHMHLQQIATQLSALERQLSVFESHQRAHWAAFEQLYLCFLSDPDRNARLQLEQLFETERSLKSLDADLAEQATASDDRNQSVLNLSVSADVQKETLLGALAALDRSHRIIARRLEDLDAENRRRWESLERLLAANLNVADQRPGTSTGGGKSHS